MSVLRNRTEVVWRETNLVMTDPAAVRGRKKWLTKNPLPFSVIAVVVGLLAAGAGPATSRPGFLGVGSADAAPAIPVLEAHPIAAGNLHTCALTNIGAVKCWGANTLGQLGDGSTADSATPVAVTGLSSNVRSLAAAIYGTCALTGVGAVKCWGNNAQGELGDGTVNDSATPVDVVGIASSALGIAAGDFHACAVTGVGGVKCWGINESGQLGDGTTTNSPIPVDVSGLTAGVQAIAAADSYTCAVTATGGVKCWGAVPAGATSSLTPVDVPGLTSGVRSIAGTGNHVCALMTAGGVKCWGGDGNVGLVGNGTTSGSTTPVDVSGLTSGVAAIAARSSSRHTCAVTSTGGVKCWGANTVGQLGDGTTVNPLTPVDVFGLSSGVAAVTTGSFHSCAALIGGGVKCWGSNASGQLGDGTQDDSLTPIDSVFRAGPVDVDADGIDDAIDTGTGTFRDGGTTAGTIGPVPAGYTVTVTDLPDPDGVRVTVSGSGLLEVTITLSNPVSGVPCGAVALLPGSNVDVVCGSITARVADESPPVRIVLSDDTSLLVGSGEQTTVSVANDGSFVVTAVSGGDGELTLVSNGVSTSIDASSPRIHLYDFVGFSRPVDNAGVLNLVKAGSNVPLRWRLLSETGAPITDLGSATVSTAQISCQQGMPTDAIEEVAASASPLQNLGNGYYQLNWKTDKEASGCAVMRLSLAGESPITHEALFKLN